MYAQIGRRRECGAIVLLRLEDDDVELRTEKQYQSHDSRQRYTDAESEGLWFAPAKVDGNESHPNDAGRVPEFAHYKVSNEIPEGYKLIEISITNMANPMNLASLKFSGRFRVLTA